MTPNTVNDNSHPEKYRSHLMPTYKPAPVVFTKGKGPYLFDENGKKYLDFLSGIAVTSLGHSHEKIVAALTAQAHELWHVSNLFQNGLAEEVAGLIDALILSSDLVVDGSATGNGDREGGKVFFTNSGAEAIECSLKLARKFSQGKGYKIVSFEGSFHGRTFGALSATGQSKKKEAFGPLLEGFIHIPYGDLEALENILSKNQTENQEIPYNLIAAVLLEPIQGENGIVVPPDNYLKNIRLLCDRYRVLMIADEIQSGLGRTGKWFGFQHDHVLPDIVTLAKSLGNGMPIGACWAKSSVADCFAPGDHGSTFGGQPLALSAAKATLEELIEIGAPQQAAALGGVLAAKLAGIAGIAEIRGKGLMLGIRLEENIDSVDFVSKALRSGLVLNSPVPGIIRLAPPYVINDSEINEATEIIKNLLSETY